MIIERKKQKSQKRKRQKRKETCACRESVVLIVDDIVTVFRCTCDEENDSISIV